MVVNISNSNALANINACFGELQKIGEIIDKEGSMAHPVPFLTKYAIIKACGTIEFCFKTILCDHTSMMHSTQIRNFIDAKIRNSSMNPSFDNICSGLKSFDTQWCDEFKKTINQHTDKARLQTSLSSLNLARNTFSHGKNTSTTFSDVNLYFQDSVTVLEILESTILGIEMDLAEEDEKIEVVKKIPIEGGANYKAPETTNFYAKKFAHKVQKPSQSINLPSVKPKRRSLSAILTEHFFRSK